MQVSRIFFWLGISAIFNPLHADITTDGSVGKITTLSGDNIQIGEDLGQQVGTNLFHSFERFSIGDGAIVRFTGSDSISNVIGRVTGGALSTIDGTLACSIDNADVYLINPAGFMFGANASLDIKGGFHAAAADSLLFSDGSRFTADVHNSTFSQAAPSAFGLGAGSLDVRGAKLAVADRQALTLAGNRLTIQQDAEISAPSGQLVLAAGNGELNLADARLSGTGGNLTITNAAVSSSGDTGGSVFIRAGQFIARNTGVVQANVEGSGGGAGIDAGVDSLSLENGGQLVSSIQKEATGAGGGLRISAAGDITLDGESANREQSALVSRATSQNVEISTGGIELNAANLTLRNGGGIEYSTSGAATRGDLDIAVTGDIHLQGSGSSGIGSFISTNARGSGTGGNLNVSAANLILDDGGLIVGGTVSSGRGGAMNLAVSGDIILRGASADGSPSALFNTAEDRSAEAGDVNVLTLKSRSLQLLDGARIVADTSGPGAGGDIDIQVDELLLDGGASVSSNAFERGPGGRMTIQTTNTTLSGTNNKGVGSAIASSTTGKGGQGGSIELTADTLTLSDGGQIGTNTFASGQGGNTQITVHQAARFSGKDTRDFASGVFTASKGYENDAGDAGNLSLTADTLYLDDGAAIVAGTSGPGKGGDIYVEARELEMYNKSYITASSDRGVAPAGDAGKIIMVLGEWLFMQDSNIETVTAFADGGDVQLDMPGMSYLSHSNITTSVRAENGNGGNLFIDNLFVIQKESAIIARAIGGNGGGINITTNGIFQFYHGANSPIDASSRFGLDGTVEIHTPGTDVSSGLVVINTSFNNDDALRNDQCTAESAAQSSSFVLSQREGVPTLGRRDYLPAVLKP